MAKLMNKIEKLIADLCPQGVEFRALGEVVDISRGRVMSKDYLAINIGKYPVYSSQTANHGIFGRISTYEYDGKYITWTTDGANAGSVFYRNGKFSITNVCGLLKPKTDDINTKYLLYILGITTKSYVNAGMGNPKLMSNVVAKIKIPTPPLAIQKEIVKILDNFTRLETELETELETRKKQYEHYREELLSFGDDVEFKELGEVATSVSSGKNKIKNESGVYPVYGSTGIIGFSDSYKYQDERLLVARVGENAGIVNRVQGNYNVSDNTLMIKLKEICNIDFIYHILINENLNQYATGGGQPLITGKKLKKIKIPIVPLSEQKRIVAILDKFDALVNDISTGLPAEISARKKQYEHYREELLSFNELKK